MKVPIITADDIKDWFSRHGVDVGLPDETIEEVARLGNVHSQENEDKRERDRLKHLKPSNKGELESSHESGDQTRRSDDDGSTPSSGNTLSVYPMRQPAPEREADKHE